MRCSRTLLSPHAQPKLTPLSAEKNGERRVHTFCHCCHSICELASNPTHYDRLPMPESLLTEGRVIPKDSGETLRGSITLNTLRTIVNTVKARKAAGDDGFPPDLWKDAPDSLLQFLLQVVNEALRTGRMPDEWRGGVVRFLLKREPSNDISNW